MKPPSDDRAAHDALREQFREAARRETVPVRRTRRARRGVIVLIAAALGASAAAGAAQLISAGKPLPDTSHPGTRYKPATPGPAKLVATAPDPGAGLKWGVGIYDTRDGHQCALAGQVRGASLGLVQEGTFHAYENTSTGACGRLSQGSAVFYDLLVVEGAAPRTIVYGRARGSERRVTVEADGKRHSTRPATGGGYLFVFEGLIGYNDVSVTTAKG